MLNRALFALQFMRLSSLFATCILYFGACIYLFSYPPTLSVCFSTKYPHGMVSCLKPLFKQLYGAYFLSSNFCVNFLRTVLVAWFLVYAKCSEQCILKHSCRPVASVVINCCLTAQLGYYFLLPKS